MARFAVGERVRVIEREVPGHNRAPHYIRAKCGIVERILGTFRNPEELAYGKYDGDRYLLYRVRFRQRDLWPDYRGADGDTIDVELYEPWVESAEVEVTK